jgi:hypothetical protein
MASRRGKTREKACGEGQSTVNIRARPANRCVAVVQPLFVLSTSFSASCLLQLCSTLFNSSDCVLLFRRAPGSRMVGTSAQTARTDTCSAWHLSTQARCAWHIVQPLQPLQTPSASPSPSPSPSPHLALVPILCPLPPARVLLVRAPPPHLGRRAAASRTRVSSTGTSHAPLRTWRNRWGSSDIR